MRPKKGFYIIFFFFITLVAVFAVSLLIGRYEVSFYDFWALLNAFLKGENIASSDKLSTISMMIFDIRFPRAIAAVLVGAGLGVSGAMLQSVFVNPLVSPKIMGVLSGASFGAAFGIITFSNWALVQLSSFVFGMVSIFLALFIARIYKSSSALLLILGGMISGAFFDALLSLVKFTADPNEELASIVFWLMGSLSMADSGSIMIKAGIPLFIAVVFSCFFGKILNILSMGDDEAKTMGLNTGGYRIFILILSTFLASLTVVIAGNIGWVGLIIPHICRMIIGPDNRYLLPFSAVGGGLFLLIADTAVRTIFPAEIPLGIVTSIIGLAVFTMVLKNSKKGWR